MSPTDTIYPESTNIGAMLTSTEYDAAHPHLNEMVEIVEGYVKSSELAENTWDQIDEAVQTMGGYSKATSHTPDKEDIGIVAILIRLQSSHLLSQLAWRNRNLLSQIHEDGQTILNPKAIGQTPSTGFIVTVTDWGTEPLTPDVSWEHTHKSISPYLPDIIAEKEYNTAPLLFSMWMEPLTVNTDPEIDKNTIWAEILAQLDTLIRWREERDEDDHEHEPEKPSESALANAKRVVKELLSAVLSEGKEILTPFTSYDQDGYITLVWRKGKHELYLEITEDEIEYVKVWGINIDSEMDTGVPSKDNYLTLWEWLLDG